MQSSRNDRAVQGWRWAAGGIGLGTAVLLARTIDQMRHPSMSRQFQDWFTQPRFLLVLLPVGVALQLLSAFFWPRTEYLLIRSLVAACLAVLVLEALDPFVLVE
jgi:hypothetical protein